MKYHFIFTIIDVDSNNRVIGRSTLGTQKDVFTSNSYISYKIIFYLKHEVQNHRDFKNIFKNIVRIIDHCQSMVTLKPFTQLFNEILLISLNFKDGQLLLTFDKDSFFF